MIFANFKNAVGFVGHVQEPEHFGAPPLVSECKIKSERIFAGVKYRKIYESTPRNLKVQEGTSVAKFRYCLHNAPLDQDQNQQINDLYLLILAFPPIPHILKANVYNFQQLPIKFL